MQFAIIGAGAMGSLYGGYLGNAGVDVSMVDVADEIVTAINEAGITVHRDDQTDIHANVPAYTDPAEVGEVAAVFIFVKSMHTEAAIKNASPLVGEDTTVITLQNGLTNLDVLGRHVSEEKLLGGYTTAGANTVEPGTVRQMGPTTTKLGGKNDERAEAVADVLFDAGIEVTVVDDPVPHIWDKQFVSVGVKPVAALTELRNEQMVEYEETRWIIEAVIEEALEVAGAKGIDSLTDDPIERTYEVLRETGSKKSSILEDVEREQPTEIDHINGAVVRYGEEEGIETPHNRMVTNLTKGKEYAYLD